MIETKNADQGITPAGAKEGHHIPQKEPKN